MNKALILPFIAFLTVPTWGEPGKFGVFDRISPHLHVNLAVGDASEPPESLAVGGHDPSDQFSVQSIEPGLSLRVTDQIEGFVTWNFSYGADAEWEEEFEEGFAKWSDLPGGFELRGGRMLNRFGDRNAKHIHAWHTIDQHLVNGRFLGTDGLRTDGAELTWLLPTAWSAALSVSYGDVAVDAHGHNEAEEEHETEDPDELGFTDDLFAANLVVKANRDDFNQFRFLGSIVNGDNGLGDDTVVGGLGAEYVWRENGLEPGGRQIRWMNEWMLRDFKAGAGHEEEAHPGGDEFGFYSDLGFTPGGSTDVGLRFGYVEGVKSFGLEERFRLSPYVTTRVLADHDLRARVQANFDAFEHSDDAQSVWFQLAYSFGGSEVR